MIYVALLRGINVGGNTKVSMSQLKTALEQTGLQAIKTYINSGNIIFRDNSHTSNELVDLVERTIRTEFGFEVKVLIRDINAMKTVAEALPASWRNDSTMKCDVMFLWDDVDHEDVLKQLIIKPEIDSVLYVPGAVLFAVDRQNVTKSGLVKIVGTPLYKKMTARNCNTTRKLFEIMSSIEEITI
jgi:uncharacterized protein (DUF1697 family)